MRARTEYCSVKLAGAGALLVTALVVPAAAQLTSRMNVDSAGAQGNGLSFARSISADGRYMAFESSASNLIIGDTNNNFDVYVRDRQTGTTERVSLDPAGAEVAGRSDHPSISADGRYVAFRSDDSFLVSGDTNGWGDIFVRDRQNATNERVSVDSSEVQANGESFSPSISADGRYVAFFSVASNLVGGDTNGGNDVFVRDRQNGTTERVSVDSGGAQGNGESFEPSISADGNYVAFWSVATNLVAGDTNGFGDVFVRDLQGGTTERVSIDSGRTQGNNDSYTPSISADGRYVAFHSFASNLVSGDTNGVFDVFVRDRQGGTTERVSIDSGGVQGNGHSTLTTISGDGRYVAFASSASNLVSGDSNASTDVFVRDCQGGTTERVSLDSSGAQGNGNSYDTFISTDGRYVLFDSLASNLVSGDTNGTSDAFVRDRFASSFTSLCDPSLDGVIACPCSNPASGSGRGCDNSAATGGASLSAAGVAYLSMNSLVFTTSGEKPTATSIVLQGKAFVSSGAVYGQGVRCAGGTLKRLYTKTAAGGSITAPDFGAGDPTISARSAAKGDTILAGQSRWYLVYYRDPVVLGGCPAESTFNATQTGRVVWSL